jgi:hypothetical protein
MLCRAFAVAHAQKAREELVRRHLFTLDEWWLIEKQQIVVGTKKPGCAEIPVR